MKNSHSIQEELDQVRDMISSTYDPRADKSFLQTMILVILGAGAFLLLVAFRSFGSLESEWMLNLGTELLGSLTVILLVGLAVQFLPVNWPLPRMKLLATILLLSIGLSALTCSWRYDSKLNANKTFVESSPNNPFVRDWRFLKDVGTNIFVEVIGSLVIYGMIENVIRNLEERERKVERLLEKIDSIRQIRLEADISASIDSEVLAPEQQIVFRDVFDNFIGWKPYLNGKFSHSTDFHYTGTHSLKKESGKDPNGCYKMIGREIPLGFVFSGWIYRPNPDKQSGAKADRLAIEDSGFYGYGFAIDHNTNQAWIERRDGKGKQQGKHIGSQKYPFASDSLVDQWYRFEFAAKPGGEFSLRIENRSGDVIVDIPTVSDENYDSFDLVGVHGGYPYYVDELEIRAL